MDFKFRVLDLMDIFIKKSNSPILFINSLIPFVNEIYENLSDKRKE